MINNIVEISTDNKELSAYRGFLRIKERGDIIKDVPFDSFSALIITGNGILISVNLLSSLCEYGIPLITLGKNYHPNGILISLIGQQRQTAIQQIQIQASVPLQKQLWAEIVKEKIKNQSKVLDILNKENKIKNVYTQVLSGDTSNKEAYCARYYFPALFGKRFIRNPDLKGINSFLNYGYAVIRATLARQIVAGGLNSSFGIKHINKLNPFCLVDDLIEPYRPIIDLKVYEIFNGIDDENKELNSEYKKILTGIINQEIDNGKGFSPLYMVMQNDVWNFVSSLKDKKNQLNYNKNMVQLLCQISEQQD